MTYNPEIHLESTVRELQRYVEDKISEQPYASAYQVVMEFPSPNIDNKKVPFNRTLIHFEIDDQQNSFVGLGENVFADNYDAATHTINPQEAQRHVLNFDVGIWAFDKSGGVTSRLRAYQLLLERFSGAQATNRLRDFSDGGDGCLEIISFDGGRFVNDTVNDVPAYRMVNASLVVRVFSRTPSGGTEPITAIETIVQNPGLTIIG